MRYPGDRHVLPLFGPWRWAPYMRGKFYWKKYQNARSFFLSHTTKLNQQKQWDVVPKSTAKIDPSNKYNIFPSFIIDQSWNTLQLKNIVLSFHPPFEPITALFTFTGLWPKAITHFRQRTKKIVKFKPINILKHIYIVCLHHLPQIYSREPFKQPYPPTPITGKLIVQQNNEKEKWTYSFSYISFIIYQKCFKFHSYKLITPLYNILYQKDACALPASV